MKPTKGVSKLDIRRSSVKCAWCRFSRKSLSVGHWSKCSSVGGVSDASNLKKVQKEAMVQISNSIVLLV